VDDIENPHFGTLLEIVKNSNEEVKRGSGIDRN